MGVVDFGQVEANFFSRNGASNSDFPACLGDNLHTGPNGNRYEDRIWLA